MSANLRDIAAHGGFFCKSCQRFTEIDPDHERLRCMNKTSTGRICHSYAIKIVDPVPGCQEGERSQFPEVHV